MMKVISFVNMKGGVAKTTLAINIAHCLATRDNLRVLVVDVDPQFNATQCLMAPDDYLKHCSDDADTILSVFDGSVRPLASSVQPPTESAPKDLGEITPYNVDGTLDLLPGSLQLYRLEMASGQGKELRLRRYLESESVKNDYDYVVIDTPPTPSIWMVSALIASDQYVIPVKADPISLTGIDLLQTIINETKQNFDLNLACGGMVLTVVEESTTVFKDAKTNLENDGNWGPHLFPMYLPKRTEIARNQLNQTMILDGTHTDAKKAITQISAEIRARAEI